VRVEASCRKSRIYHSAAAAERVARGIQNSFAAGIADDARVTVHVRLDHDQCSIGLDTSGDLLHKRGFKAEVGKAPMRETVAAMLLRLSGYDGREPVVDPMCGSGTFVIEAAEIAAGLNPGRGRSFAFEHLATFDAAAWQKMRKMSARPKSDAHAYGSDRDTGAIRMSVANALRAGVEARTTFARHTISEIRPPAGPPGLVIVNPPYGDRIGDKERLKALHGALGRTLLDRFKGWRVALVTSEKTLAYATSLPFLPPSAPIATGGLRITLFQTGPLP
jgi:putative N6-adenine-specific DNA methylase